MYTIFALLWGIALLTIFFRPPYTYTSFHRPVYGAKIEDGHYYLRIDQTKQEYQEVTREQYEEVDRATTYSPIALVGMGLGLVGIVCIGDKFGLLPKLEKSA